MANTNMVEFQRGTKTVYDLLKTGKVYTFAEFKRLAKKAKVAHPLTTAYRIGRIGEAAKQFTVSTEINRDDVTKSTIRMTRKTAKAPAKKTTKVVAVKKVVTKPAAKKEVAA